MLFEKDKAYYDADDIIKVITGVCRCGKSHLMRSIADELLERGVPEKDIVFLDLYSRKLRNIRTPDQLERAIVARLEEDEDLL